MKQTNTGDGLGQDLAGLEHLDLGNLRRRWRTVTGRAAPEQLPRALLVRMLAYRIQANAFGDLDRDSIRVLRDVAEQRVKGVVPTLEGLNLSSRGERTLAPGTVLGREHLGVVHHVMVLTEGFAWNGVTYRSLSDVAFAITGTKWNGPRFFGLGKYAGKRGAA